MMTPTRVLQHVEMMLGVPFQVMELKDEEIMDIIEKYTLPTYSKFYPYYTVVPIKPNEHKVEHKKEEGKYFIETDLTILGVTKLLYNGKNVFDYGMSMNVAQHDPIAMKQMADVQSMGHQPMTFQYHAPNMVEIFPKSRIYSNDFSVEIKAVHPSHMATIPENMHDEFLRLCEYDVKIALYPIRSRFQNIPTTFGSIELFMDGFEDAKSARDDLLEKWRNNFYKSSKRRKIFVY